MGVLQLLDLILGPNVLMAKYAARELLRRMAGAENDPVQAASESTPPTPKE